MTPPSPSPDADPVLARRARIARQVSLAIKVSVVCYGLAVVEFFVALLTRFTDFHATSITLLLLVGSVLLAPAMVFHYAVKAADRADREDSW